MATERQILGQAQRILVDATNQIWHKISLWTHVSDVEMQDGTPLNEFLTDMNDDLNERIDGKYNSYNLVTTNIANLSQIPEVGYSRIKTTIDITAGDYTIPANHYCYCYSGKDPNSIEKMAVMIDTTDLTSIVMYIAHYSIEARWTLTKIATQKQIDSLQDQINNLNAEFNRLNLFVESSIGNLNARYQIIQNQMDWLEAELAELQEFLNDLLNELRDFKRAINGRVDEIDKIFKALYGQIGSIFITTSPLVNGEKLNELFGGEWHLVRHAYLYAGGDGRTTSPHGDTDNVDVPSKSNVRIRNGIADFSDLYDGRHEFVLEKRNLPKHFHKVVEGEYEMDAAPGVKLKQKLPDLPNKSFGEDYVGVYANVDQPDYNAKFKTIALDDKNTVRRNEFGGLLWWSAITGSNEFPGEALSYPVMLDPTFFKLYVWCRIA